MASVIDETKSVNSRYYRFRGCTVVLGGFLLMGSFSLYYSIGNMLPYIASYVHARVEKEGNVYETLSWISGLTSVGQGIAFFLNGFIVEKLGFRITAAMGCCIEGAGFALSYYTIKHSVPGLLVTHGLMLGLGFGLIYIIPISLVMKWFPNNKAFAAGIVFTSFGIGSFFFNQVQTYFVNPHNIKVSGNSTDTMKYFDDPELLDRVPNMYFAIVVLTSTMQVIALLLIAEPPERAKVKLKIGNKKQQQQVQTISSNIYEKAPVHQTRYARRLSSHSSIQADQDVAKFGKVVEDNKKVLFLTPKQVLRTREYYLLALTWLLSIITVQFLATVYKTFGQVFIEDDQYLSLIGSIGCAFNTVGRIVWGYLQDKFPFKILICIMFFIMTATYSSWYFTMHMGKTGFSVWYCLMMFAEAGSFVMLPPYISHTFGSKYLNTIFGMVTITTIIAGIISSTLTQLLLGQLGWLGMFIIMGVISAICMVINVFHGPPHVTTE